ncbi:PmoA family protein [Stieleria sp. TO1_6]|uniref:DUF6807 family protein n=1 Tax=Stieleria tagensis TaxID=2956795 RepID=UPI00209ABF6D|nr:DUF6807 family protein [Stieleria tagensis]MCO8122770.1 PmoA family protein [Stieleria tagensis]
MFANAIYHCRLLSVAVLVITCTVDPAPLVAQSAEVNPADAKSVDDDKTPASQRPATVGFHCTQTESALIVSYGDAEVLRYNIVAPKPTDPAHSVYQRSGYIHPLYSPSGKLVSGDFAPDHPHQHGLFAAWTNTSFRGKPVDFWNQGKSAGLVLHDRVIAIDNQQHTASFQVGLNHAAIDEDGNRTVILDDVWTVAVSLADQTDQTAARYVIDFSIAQTNITEHPLTINEYHYGGIGFRGNNDWYTAAGTKALNEQSKSKSKQPAPPIAVTRHQFLTSEGHDRFQGNHSRPDWTSLYGIVQAGDADDQDTALAGIKFRGDPNDLFYPHPVRLHPNKPYFSVSPCVLGTFDINPGDTFRARGSFEIFDGQP